MEPASKLWFVQTFICTINFTMHNIRCFSLIFFLSTEQILSLENSATFGVKIEAPPFLSHQLINLYMWTTWLQRRIIFDIFLWYFILNWFYTEQDTYMEESAILEICIKNLFIIILGGFCKNYYIPPYVECLNFLIFCRSTSIMIFRTPSHS